MPFLEISLLLKGELIERLKARGLSLSKHCLVVSVDQQKLWHFSDNQVDEYRVSTARAGIGCVKDSLRTPVGLLAVSEMIGTDQPKGMVFKGRRPTGQLWQEGEVVSDNLITSRIIWLEGLETGINRGLNSAGQVVDTKERYIYIHGTNQASEIGQPNSHGCILLSDADVIKLFSRVAVGTPVYIK